MASPEMSPEFLRQVFGDPAEIAERISNFRKDAVFFSEHRTQLKEQYPDQYVAIKGEQVVAASPLLDELLPRIEEQGLNTSDLYISFLPTKEIPQIFVAA